MALLFGGPDGEAGRPASDILIAAGWRVAVVTAGTSLADAWRELHSPARAGLFRRMVSAEAPPVPRTRAGDTS